jgi:hypothetical protein
MNTISATDCLAIIGMSRVAAINPEALRLTAQILGVPPCPVCDFRKEYCRCKEKQ